MKRFSRGLIFQCQYLLVSFLGTNIETVRPYRLKQNSPFCILIPRSDSQHRIPSMSFESFARVNPENMIRNLESQPYLTTKYQYVLFCLFNTVWRNTTPSVVQQRPLCNSLVTYPSTSRENSSIGLYRDFLFINLERGAL